MTITQMSLQQDANDGLAEFYTKEAELKEHIKTFEEAITTTRDELRALRKQWKPKLKQAGQANTHTQMLIKLIEEKQPIYRGELTRLFAEEATISVHEVSKFILALIRSKRLVIEGDGVVTINPHWKDLRGTRTGLREAIIEFLRQTSNPVSAGEIVKNFNTVSGSSVRTAILDLVKKNKIGVNKYRSRTILNTYYYIVPVPKGDPRQCSVTVSSSSSL